MHLVLAQNAMVCILCDVILIIPPPTPLSNAGCSHLLYFVSTRPHNAQLLTGFLPIAIAVFCIQASSLLFPGCQVKTPDLLLFMFSTHIQQCTWCLPKMQCVCILCDVILLPHIYYIPVGKIRGFPCRNYIGLLPEDRYQ